MTLIRHVLLTLGDSDGSGTENGLSGISDWGSCLDNGGLVGISQRLGEVCTSIGQSWLTSIGHRLSSICGDWNGRSDSSAGHGQDSKEGSDLVEI